MDGKCIQYPVPGYYIEEPKTDKGYKLAIKECPLGCLTCSQDECLSCRDSFRLVNGICHHDCDLKYVKKIAPPVLNKYKMGFLINKLLSDKRRNLSAM